MILLHASHPSNHIFNRHNNKNVKTPASCMEHISPNTSNTCGQQNSKRAIHRISIPTPSFKHFKSKNDHKTKTNDKTDRGEHDQRNNYIPRHKDSFQQGLADQSRITNNTCLFNENITAIDPFQIANFISRMLAFYFNSHGLRVHTRRYRIKRCIMAVAQPLLNRNQCPLLPVNSDEFMTSITKMLRHTKTESITGMMALMYFDRFVNTDPDALCTTGQFLRWYGVCLMLACKVHEDRFIRNIRWTKMMKDAGTSLATKEANHMELSLLHMFEWEVFIPVRDLEAYLMNCCKLSPTTKALPKTFSHDLFHYLGISFPQDKKKVSFQDQNEEQIGKRTNARESITIFVKEKNETGLSNTSFSSESNTTTNPSKNKLERSASYTISETVSDSYSSCSTPYSNLILDQNTQDNFNNDTNNNNEEKNCNDINFTQQCQPSNSLPDINNSGTLLSVQ